MIACQLATSTPSKPLVFERFQSLLSSCGTSSALPQNVVLAPSLTVFRKHPNTCLFDHCFRRPPEFPHSDFVISNKLCSFVLTHWLDTCVSVQSVMAEFVNIELMFHAKALEMYTQCYQSLHSQSQQDDLQVLFVCIHMYIIIQWVTVTLFYMRLLPSPCC